MSRLLDALQRAQTLREKTRHAIRAEAPACALHEAPPPRFAEVAEPPILEDEVPRLEAPHRDSGRVRLAITAIAGLLLAALFAWFLATSHEAQRPPGKPAGLKLDYQLPAKK
jgi:hypothetical protein